MHVYDGVLMATEHDLSDLLPPYPLPRPARREEAVGAAMRRFDGLPEPRKASTPRRPWRVMGKPQLGGLVAAALIAAIGFPLWLSGDRPIPVASTTAATDTAIAPQASDSSTAETAAISADTAGRQAPEAAAVSPAPMIAAAPPARIPTDSTIRVMAETAGAAVPSVSPPAPPPPAPPPPPAAMAMADEASDLGNIVVTGSRVSGWAQRARMQIERRYETAGAWNACTVADPRRNLAFCRRSLRAGVPGAAGQSGALIGEGLDRAWQDDDGEAIAAFDKAIGLAPKSGAAWLNRGLAHAKSGDDDRALADLDKAVRYAPNDARTWAQRSLILRRIGKTARADADAARASRLDPSIDRLFE